MKSGEERYITARGKKALRQLWELSQSEETTRAERIKLLELFVAMAYGKPTTMEAVTDKGGGGIVILPAVDSLGMSTGPRAAAGPWAPGESEYEKYDA